MTFSTTPLLHDNLVSLLVLTADHYNALYTVAADPELWKYHPINDAFTKEGFTKFFNEALAIGALVITEKASGNIIGCTRFYNYDENKCSVVIGHTFIARAYWGKGYNTSVKKLMLNYAFQFVEKVIFYVVTENIRSQKALLKLGATAQGNITRNYDGKVLECVVFEVGKDK